MSIERLAALTLTNVRVAVYVAPGTGSLHYPDRPFHGLIINEGNTYRDYIFSDGTVLKTAAYDVFYLPRTSTYRVEYPLSSDSGCYAVNFDTVEDDILPPFKIGVRDHDAVFRLYKKLCTAYEGAFPDRRAVLLSQVYELIGILLREANRDYVPKTSAAKLMPADTLIRARFADAALSIGELAAACGVSDTYFRRLFKSAHGISPQKYITTLRMNRACELLSDGGFSVERTAYLCGYTDAGYFSREFEKVYGASAGQFKRTRGAKA